MAITLITGVPGTGKTAFVVSELEKIAATGRIIFVDNIPDLKIPHYRAGNIASWQKGTWFHIDVYKRTTPAPVVGTGQNLSVEYGDEEEDDNLGDESWEPNPHVIKAESGELLLKVYADYGTKGIQGECIGTVPYESHKGALLVIDEAQRHFRPRPAGSPVPDHVAALEVHRKQCDIWIITQRPGLIDSNVRGLCGRHIALRDTPFGRYKYEWPEVGDIESKTSRDTAAKSRYKLPKHVFNLYKSAEVHTKHKHTLPLAAKVLLIALPVGLFFAWSSYKTITGKFHPEKAKAEKTSSVFAEQKADLPEVAQSWRVLGWYYSEKDLMVSLEGEGGKIRFLRNPPSFRITGRELSVMLPEGGQATSYMSFQKYQNRGYEK